MSEGDIPSEGFKHNFRALPPEFQHISDETLRRVNSPDVDDFYGVSETSTTVRVFHGTLDCKLPMIAEEGLKAFVERENDEPRIYVSASPTLSLWYASTIGPHYTLRKTGQLPAESALGKPVLLLIEVDKEWLAKQPDSQKPLELPQWLKEKLHIRSARNRRISAFTEELKEDVEWLKQGKESSDFGLSFPTDLVPAQFISVVGPNGNEPVDQYAVVTQAA